jgi:response regulator NasT
MEGKSGFDVATYLRDYSRIPFIFLSAFADDDTVAQVKALGAVAYLVKPLDIGQIVPVVEAAFETIRAQRLEAANAPAEPAVGAMLDPVAMAVGVLMHRYSLARGPALERLHRLAEAEQRSIPEQAERLLEAVEVLSLPARS